MKKRAAVAIALRALCIALHMTWRKVRKNVPNDYFSLAKYVFAWNSCIFRCTNRRHPVCVCLWKARDKRRAEKCVLITFFSRLDRERQPHLTDIIAGAMMCMAAGRRYDKSETSKQCSEVCAHKMIHCHFPLR